MATKKKVKPAPRGSQSRLKNLAARPTSFGDEPTFDDGMLADNSGVFHVTSALQQRNVADDDFRTVAPPPAAVVDEVVDDDATAVLKRERLRALAARDAVRRTNRR
jgi:hypothetical protein